MRNEIRTLRERAGLSQKMLAEAVGTSQQQIARIETGHQAVKLDIALRISEALGASLGSVFPGTRELLGKGKNRKTRDQLVELHYDGSALQKFDSAGVDLDPATWRVQMRLRGRAEVGFVLSAADASHVRQDIMSPSPSTPFVVFNSNVVMVAVNLNHLMHYHELWDAHTPTEWHDEQVPLEEVGVFLCDSPEPLRFNVEVDEADAADEFDNGQLHNLIFTLENLVEPGEFIHFMDSDGEHAFFRAHDIAVLTVPLRLLNSTLNDDLLEADYGPDADEGGDDGDIEAGVN